VKEFETAKNLIEKATKITVIQAENPDGDSLGSALALEEIFGEAGKEVQLFCPVDIPKYLRYFSGWDRISDNLWPSDLFVIVDTASQVLLSKIWENPLYRNLLEKTPILVIDHHTDATPDLEFSHEIILKEASSCAEVIFDFAKNSGFEINQQAAEHLMGAILSDTLGFSTQNVSPETFEIASQLTKLGASTAKIEEARREFSKKSPEILEYKGELIRRIEYFLDGKLALVHIPWDEIKKYSDKYNPSVLVIDEMRLVEGVEVCVAIKTYPDGKLTGKVRTNSPVAADIAGYFGGGGHAYAAGFRVYEKYDEILRELLTATERVLR
jgi:phosphoesterase RecJ-like protein